MIKSYKITTIAVIIFGLIQIIVYGRAVAQDFNIIHLIIALVFTPVVISIGLIPLFLKFKRVNTLRKNGMVAYPAKNEDFSSRKLFALASNKNSVLLIDVSTSDIKLLACYPKSTTSLRMADVSPGGFSTIPGIEVHPENGEPIRLIMYDKSFFIKAMVKPDRIKTAIAEYMDKS